MCKLVLDRGNVADYTSVSNFFIDEYMPQANGEFVKVYLYLLRLVDSNSDSVSDELSTEAIADQFGLLEADVYRALEYWAKHKLLTLAYNDEQKLSGVKVETVVSKQQEMEETQMLAKASGESISVPAPGASGFVIPKKRGYSDKELVEFSTDERVRELNFVTQTYLGRPLTPNDMASLLYMLEGLGLDSDFIIYLMETYMSQGSKSLHSVEEKAIEFVQKGIVTEEDAKAYGKLHTKILQSVYRTFGIDSKVPVKHDVAFVNKWSDDYKFSEEMIVEACNRTMTHTHSGSFEYTDSILSAWLNKGAHTLDDVAQLDEEHKQSQTDTSSKADSKTVGGPRHKSHNKRRRQKKILSHKYDFDKVENELLDKNKK